MKWIQEQLGELMKGEFMNSSIEWMEVKLGEVFFSLLL